MNKLLWPDERIHRELDIATDAMLDYATSFNVGLDVALKVSKAMRDEYEARIAALEAPGASVQGQEWVPVPDGTYGEYDTVTVDGNFLAIDSAYGIGHKRGTMLPLPDDIRLCRRTPAPALPGPLVMPPDRFGTVVIWPQGEVQERMFSSRIEIFPAYNPPFEPGIRWTGRELIGIEITRQWAKAMLLAANIAESMRQRPAAQDGEQSGKSSPDTWIDKGE